MFRCLILLSLLGCAHHPSYAPEWATAGEPAPYEITITSHLCDPVCRKVTQDHAR